MLAMPPILTTSFVPSGATVQILGNFAVLAGHTLLSGQVSVVDLTMSPPKPVVGSMLAADGLRAATLATFTDATGTMTSYVALGFPNRVIGGVTGGQVELHVVDPAGMLTAAPAAVLNDAQPEANQLFGRALAIMTMNGKPILVVSASSEIIAYYQTSLYPAVR
jgi:hypothetical protein